MCLCVCVNVCLMRDQGSHMAGEHGLPSDLLSALESKSECGLLGVCVLFKGDEQKPLLHQETKVSGSGVSRLLSPAPGQLLALSLSMQTREPPISKIKLNLLLCLKAFYDLNTYLFLKDFLAMLLGFKVSGEPTIRIMTFSLIST